MSSFWTYHSLILLDINLIAQDNLSRSGLHLKGRGVIAYEWKAVGISRGGLDQELVSPAV
jgi:hypothetical protein